MEQGYREDSAGKVMATGDAGQVLRFRDIKEEQMEWTVLTDNELGEICRVAGEVGSRRFILFSPFWKRIWQSLMLIIKGWCYLD